jgi:cytoskeleton protein RodZ
VRRRDSQSADDESSSGEYSSVGEMLRNTREALDLKVKQVAGDLRIEVPYLVALEENDFDEFSAPVFAKGYLKQYALRLGLDDKELLMLYYRQVGTQQIPKLRVQTIETGEDKRQARWLITGSVVVLAVAAVSFWQFSTLENEMPVISQVANISDTELARATLAEEPQIMTVTTLTALDPAGQLVMDPVEDPAEVVVPALQVEIVFHEDCWAVVIDARGERLFYGLGRAGARSRFSATPPASFFLGNANGVDILVDNAPYGIPDESRQGNLARFVILESGD